jgi:hypothetical protein
MGLAPEILEPIRRQLGIAHRVLDILVPQPACSDVIGRVAGRRMKLAATHKDKGVAGDATTPCVTGRARGKGWVARLLPQRATRPLVPVGTASPPYRRETSRGAACSAARYAPESQ